LSASRTEGRETPKSSASSRSGGSLSPGPKEPVRIDDRICSAIWVEIFLGFIGLKMVASLQAGMK